VTRSRIAKSPADKRLRARAEDVVACYRLFLGREPENEDVVAAHLYHAPRLWDMIGMFFTSPESVLRRISEASAAISDQQDTSDVEWRASAAELPLLIEHIRQVWSRYGREEAYYSVLTDPAYLMERLETTDIESFYATGLLEMERFEAVCRRNFIEPDPSWEIFELGCGVGRVGEAFASKFSAYIGVDISAEHIAIAQKRLAERGLANTTLALLDDFLSGDASTDVFFSMIVLQHNPPPIIHDLLDLCLARVRPKGLAYFQVPCHLYDYRFCVTDYLAGQGQSETMEIHALPQRDVFALLARHGLNPIEVTPDDRIGPIGFSYTFLARKEC